jgi:hypothetical protein
MPVNSDVGTRNKDNMDGKSEYLKMQYEEGARIIRHYIDCRYKILQFAGYYNAAVLTVGAAQGLLFTDTHVLHGLALSILSFFVALMGLATEYSTASYNYGYFETLREIEKAMAGIHNDIPPVSDGGVITHSRETIKGNWFHNILPVHRAHKLFYSLLSVFWAGSAVWHIMKA